MRASQMLLLGKDTHLRSRLNCITYRCIPIATKINNNNNNKNNNNNFLIFPTLSFTRV